MTLNAARTRFALSVITLIVCLPATIAVAQSPDTAPSASTPTSQAGALPTPAAGTLGTTFQRLDSVKWTDVAIFIVMIVGILLQVFGILVQAAISAYGLALVWYQITLVRDQVSLVKDQVDQLNRGIQGETHSKLYEHYLNVNQLLANKSELRPYFYAGKPLREDAAGYADLREEIDMMCEMIAGLLEHAAVQRENLPVDSWEACWMAYTYERFDKSIELRKFFRENHVWYAKSFCEVVKKKFPHLVSQCTCETEVAVRVDCQESNSAAPVVSQAAA